VMEEREAKQAGAVLAVTGAMREHCSLPPFRRITR